MESAATEALVSSAAALALALLLSPAVRVVTADLDDTVGRVWPFALTHCHVRTSPGCAAPAARHVAAR